MRKLKAGQATYGRSESKPCDHSQADAWQSLYDTTLSTSTNFIQHVRTLIARAKRGYPEEFIFRDLETLCGMAAEELMHDSLDSYALAVTRSAPEVH